VADHISVDEANAWVDSTKLAVSSIDANLEQQVTASIFARLLGTFDTTTWINTSTTPQIVRTIIAMYYISWIYDRAYSDDAESNAYAALLRQYADANIAGLVAGTIELAELPDANAGVSSPTFFPTDFSSSQEPTDLNPSDGPPAFTMGTTF
jgi:hypothetical protein